MVMPDSANCLAMSPDGKWVASANNTIQVWNADTGHLVRTLEPKGRVAALAWSSDGRQLAAMGSSTEIGVGNVPDGARIWQKGPFEKSTVLAMRFVNDDRMLAIAFDKGVVELWPVGQTQPARVWTFDEGKRAEFNALAKELAVSDISFSPSGARMA